MPIFNRQIFGFVREISKHPWTDEEGWELIHVNLPNEPLVDRLESLLSEDGFLRYIRDNKGNPGGLWIRKLAIKQKEQPQT